MADNVDNVRAEEQLQRDGAQPQQDGAQQDDAQPAPQQDGAQPQQDGAQPLQHDGAQLLQQDGAHPQKDGAQPQKDGAQPQKDGAQPQKDGAPPQKDGAQPQKDGAQPQKDGAQPQKDGAQPQKDGASSEESWYECIELVLIIYAPIMMLCQTLLHFYVESRIVEDHYPELNMHLFSPYKDLNYMLPFQHKVQRLTSTWMTNILTVEYFLSVFSIYAIHLLNDVYGRKFGMLVSLSGTMIKLMLITVTIKFNLPFNVLFMASAINGITGGAASFITSVVSHISEKNKVNKSCFNRFIKAQFYAIGISGFFIISFGFIMNIFGIFFTSLCLLFLTVLCIFAILFLLKKSPKEVDCKSSIIKSSFGDLWNVVPIRKFLLLFFFLSFGSFNYLPVGGQTFFVTQFFINKLSSSCTIATGMYLAIFAFSFFVTNFFAMNTSTNDISSIMVVNGCLILGFISCVVLSLTMKIIYYQTVVINSVAVYAIMYVITREMSDLVGVHLHGVLYALMFSINSFATTLMLPLLNKIYSSTFTYFPGSVFFIYAAIFLIAAGFEMGMMFHNKDKKA